MPTDPSAGSGGQQPSEEEIRAYLGQLREAPVEQVLAEVSSALLNAAQVKLGRPDARVLIDGLGALAEQVRERVPEDLSGQLDQAVTQLRTAQVEAEQQMASAGGEGEQEAVGEPGGSGQPGQGAGGPGAGTASQPGQQGGGSDPTSRLWIPGR